MTRAVRPVRPMTALAAVVALAVSPGLLRAQAQHPQHPSWDEYALVQFIAAKGTAPATILDLDNNGALALLAEDGITRATLRLLTGANESQVRLLEAWRLLERAGDTLRTSFPVLDAVETRELRSRTRAAADRLVTEIAADALELRRELERSGRAETAYAILFSYVLDGLTWEIWEGDGRIAGREISVERPYWDGHIWAVTPTRPDLAGTNRISDERGALFVTWSHAAIPSMAPFVANWPAVEALFEAFAAERAVGPPAREVFAPYGLFDDSGSLTIPVIATDGTDALHVRARRIAEAIAAKAPAALDLPSLRRRFNFRSDAQALVIGYHELMWDVLDQLVAGEVVERPPVLDGHASGPGDVRALVFGVR